nr:MAG TPA: hypothetical protein [Caudoviricetes sp.]
MFSAPAIQQVPIEVVERLSRTQRQVAQGVAISM